MIWKVDNSGQSWIGVSIDRVVLVGSGLVKGRSIPFLGSGPEENYGDNLTHENFPSVCPESLLVCPNKCSNECAM